MNTLPTARTIFVVLEFPCPTSNRTLDKAHPRTTILRMQRKLLRCFLAGLIFPLTAGAADAPRLTGAGCEQFGFDFYRKLSATEPYQLATDANVAISPLSLASVLQAFRLGASGKAEQELSRALDFRGPLAGKLAGALKPSDLNIKSVEFCVGNSLWVDKRFELKSGFVKSTKKQLDAAMFPADFTQPDKVANRINLWISDHTAGHIKDLVTPASVKNASLAVANAVYFKAEWDKPFDAAKTKEELFHLASGKTVEVSMMNKVAECRYAEQDGVKILELPYAGREVSMLLMLPAPGAKGWEAMEATLTAEDGHLFGWTVGALENRTVTVKVPRWKITCKPPNCISVLKSMGVERLFKSSWDFTGISDQGPLYVNVFMHRTWMEVNEKGTEATAATLAVMLTAGVPQQSKAAVFIADRPFLFVIRHNATGTPLFVGRVSNPSAKQP